MQSIQFISVAKGTTRSAFIAALIASTLAAGVAGAAEKPPPKDATTLGGECRPLASTPKAAQAAMMNKCIVVKSFETDSKGRLVIKSAWLCEKTLR